MIGKKTRTKNIFFIYKPRCCSVQLENFSLLKLNLVLYVLFSISVYTKFQLPTMAGGSRLRSAHLVQVEEWSYSRWGQDYSGHQLV